jgi:hypothetical protein
MLTQRTAVVAQVVSYELGVRLHCYLALKDISLHYDTVMLRQLIITNYGS